MHISNKTVSDNLFLFSSHDRTETGHILGRATQMAPVSAPERKLNRASFAVLRLLTHISMYVGANVNIEVRYKIKKITKITKI